MDALWYGGDYNPEQWPREVWDDDVRLMRRAGVTVATVGVFSWSKLEPSDGVFDLAWLDELMDLLHANGVRVDLATATASPPAWLAQAHPEMLPVTADGVRLGFGSRQHYNPSSAVYRRYAARLVRVLAERYGSHPALETWHVNNEYGCHVSRDYSVETAVAFRGWLERRHGSIDALNLAWGTAFWSQHYSSFDQVEPPRAMPTIPNPAHELDFDRFSSDALLECYLAEKAILKEVTPDVPVTTNFMGFFKPVDYWSWAPHVDVVTDDCYPDPADPDAVHFGALARDLMRSLGDGAPWLLMEQAPSAVNWRPHGNAAKPAGMHRLLSLQAVARGADGIMQFQWRQSAAGSEKFHSAMVPHGGEDTRIFRETCELGADLARISQVRGARSQARVAVVMDWPSWWALEQDSTPAPLSYLDLVQRWHRAFWRRGLLVDFVRADGDLAGYDVVVAAGAIALSDEAVANLAAVPERGAQLVVGFQTAVLDETLHVRLGGYLGQLQDTLGLWIEEFTPPVPAPGNAGAQPLTLDGLAAGEARTWAEVVRNRTAEVRASFVGGELDGQPAITRQARGDGAGWYLATEPDDLDAVVTAVLADAGIDVPVPPAGVEVVVRGDLTFVLNHGRDAADVDVDGRTLHVPAMDAVVLTADGTDLLAAPQA